MQLTFKRRINNIYYYRGFRNNNFIKLFIYVNNYYHLLSKWKNEGLIEVKNKNLSPSGDDATICPEAHYYENNDEDISNKKCKKNIN